MSVSSASPPGDRVRVDLRRWSLAAVAAFYVLLHLFVLPPDGFYSGDQGAKYLQARAFADRGPFEPWIVGPEPTLDPGARFIHPALIAQRGHVVSVFAWLLPLLTAPFLKILGLRGLYVVPAVSALVIFVAARRLGERLGVGDGTVSAWVALVATPAIFYGAEIWEHAPAAAAAMAGAALLAPDRPADPRRFAVAGLVLSIGALFREEVAVAAAAFVLARTAIAGFKGQWLALAALAAGFAAIAVASMPMNAVVYGTRLSAHTTSELAKGAAYFAIRADAIRELLLPATLRAPYVICAVVVAIATLVKRWTIPRSVVAHATVLALFAIGFLVPVWRIYVDGVPEVFAISGSSLAHIWPFCFLLPYWLLLPRKDVREDVGRFLWLSSILFVAIAVAAPAPSAGGAQWGPRYLFPAAPLAAVLVSATIFPIFRLSSRHAIVVRVVSCAVIAASVAVQMDGMRNLRNTKNLNAQITRQSAKLTSPGDVVVSDLYWYPQIVETLYGSRRLYFAWSREDVAEMANRVSRAGLPSFNVVVSVPHTGYVPPNEFPGDGACPLFVRVGRADIGGRALELDHYVCGRDRPATNFVTPR